MTTLSPSAIKQLCETYDLRPSKKYGQNYLISGVPIQKMITAASIQKDDMVYEIGPGFGVLTFALLEAGARVRAFEIEKKLQPYWEKYTREYPNLEIVWGNVLKNWNNYIASEKEYTVVANLPYQITSEALEVMLTSENPPHTIVCMVQKEVGERIAAHAGDMSILAVSVQYFGKPKIVASVSRGLFYPSPKVDSAIIAITDIEKKGASKSFFDLVKMGFHHKRKMLLKNISAYNKKDKKIIEDAFAHVSLDTKIRAEELSVEQWIKLHELLTS